MEEIKSYDWPDPDHVDLSGIRSEAAKYADRYAILGGDSSPFWHDLTDLLGMENTFFRMYTEPEVVHYILARILEYYLEASTGIFVDAADLIDIFFKGICCR